MVSSPFLELLFKESTPYLFVRCRRTCRNLLIDHTDFCIMDLGISDEGLKELPKSAVHISCNGLHDFVHDNGL